MKSNRSRYIAAALLALTLQTVLPAGDLAAQNGTMERRTLTFSGSATTNLAFGIQSLLVGDPNAPPSTILQLEFGKDGLGTVNDPGLGTGVNFTLTRTSAGGGTLAFTISSLPSGNTSIAGKEITMAQPDPTNTPGLFSLVIVHTASTASAETWTLALSGLPTPSPAIRGIASLSGASTGFTTLAPVGACGAGTTTATVCPLGEKCRAPCGYGPLNKFLIYYVEFQYPHILPDTLCPACGIPWKAKFDNIHFDRSMVVYIPTPEQRLALERDSTKVSPFSVKGGDLIGGVLQGRAGQLLQIVQYPKGKPPIVSIAASAAIPTEPPVTPRTSDAGSPGNLLYGLGGLIIGALATAVGLRSRGGPGDTSSSTKSDPRV